MKNPRLYQNTLLNVNDELTLDPYASHHLVKVLRFPQGKNVTLFNGDGENYVAKVLQTKKNYVICKKMC
jgi:16S rRNA (uracil1498-N3)-methyltransferase